MSFGDDVNAWVNKSSDRMSLVLRKITLDLLQRIIMRTPVDTGRARGNWAVNINAPSSEVYDARDPSGSATIQAANTMAARIEAGDTVFIINNLPYIIELEYGWSDQSPQGMVRITAREYSGVVAAMAQETIQERR